MTIESSDPQALLLLSAPRSPVVRLVRRISAHEPTAGSVGVKGAKKFPGLEYESNVQEVTTAVWWQDPHGSDPRNPQRKVLHGEIHLSKSLKPSCCLGRFEISVRSHSHHAPCTGLPILLTCTVLGCCMLSESGRLPTGWGARCGVTTGVSGHWNGLRCWATAENLLAARVR